MSETAEEAGEGETQSTEDQTTADADEETTAGSEPESDADEVESDTESDSGDESAAAHTDQGILREERTDPESVSEEGVDADDSIEGVLAIRQTLQSSATQLIGREFDAVSEVVPTEDGWQAVVEVVERRAVPDTQDVIGRYEVELDDDGIVHGYRRLDRYRRGDTTQFA